MEEEKFITPTELEMLNILRRDRDDARASRIDFWEQAGRELQTIAESLKTSIRDALVEWFENQETGQRVDENEPTVTASRLDNYEMNYRPVSVREDS